MAGPSTACGEDGPSVPPHDCPSGAENPTIPPNGGELTRPPQQGGSMEGSVDGFARKTVKAIVRVFRGSTRSPPRVE